MGSPEYRQMIDDPADAALRELKEEAGIDGSNPQLVCVKGKEGRDPRKHVITIAFWVQIKEDADVKAGDDAATCEWYDLEMVLAKEKISFDHMDIIKEFVEKRNKGRFD